MTPARPTGCRSPGTARTGSVYMKGAGSMFQVPLNSRRPTSQKSMLASALSMIEGHHRFLQRNTGDTIDATLQHYVQNTQGVVAVWYWKAYEAYFYAGQPIPETPQRRIANWIVNAKEPVLANWPLNVAE